MSSFTLTHRRILYSLFFLVFFITAPIVILWAEGYRYNFSQHRLQKTGVLFLESKPARAEIYLNNKLQNAKTTARLKNLLPDEYLVEIKKEGYQPWQKKLKVEEGQTTFTQYIRLFKSDPKIENILTKKITLTSQVVNNDLALVFTENNSNFLAIFSLENKKLTELTALNFMPQEIELSPQAKFILLTTPYAEKLVFDIAQQKIINLTSLAQKNAQTARWQIDERDEILFLQTTNGLLKTNLVSKESIALLNFPILDFYISNSSIYFLQNSNSQILLNKAELNDLKNIQTLVTLPISDNYEFQKSSNKYLSLLDKKNSIFYLMRLEDNPPAGGKEIFPEVDYIRWSPDEKTVLLANDFEILVYDLEKQEKNLIVRLSQKIFSARWYPIATHIVYLTADNIKTVEYIDIEKYFNVLVEQANIQNFFINSTGNEIYFIDEQGINLVEIQ
ncbi:PEGA domain-containing protein [Patescibacteria group bacterium]|nr:PEGA domain-containing protein [Patescibacteria group bacterium]